MLNDVPHYFQPFARRSALFTNTVCRFHYRCTCLHTYLEHCCLFISSILISVLERWTYTSLEAFCNMHITCMLFYTRCTFVTYAATVLWANSVHTCRLNYPKVIAVSIQNAIPYCIILCINANLKSKTRALTAF